MSFITGSDIQMKNQPLTSRSPIPRTDTMDQKVISDLNSSILQATEIQNRIKKVQQMERSPLLDNYSSLNEPHAHPFGMIQGIHALSGMTVAGGMMNTHLEDPTQRQNGQSLAKFNDQQHNLSSSNLNETIPQVKKLNLAGVMKMDRVFPINLSYRNSSNATTAVEGVSNKV